MSGESKSRSCQCKELALEVAAVKKDNQRLAKMIRDLREENESLVAELRNQTTACFGRRARTTGDECEHKAKFDALVEINHGWKKDYEELKMRFEMLQGEKRLVEDEEKELRERLGELEAREEPLEAEIARLASALYARRGSESGLQSLPSEEECEILKSQIIVFKEDFERERKDRVHLHEENEKLQEKLQDAEEIIRKLTAELDACKALEEARRHRLHYTEEGYLSERAGISRPHVRLVMPYSSTTANQTWRLEQQRRGIVPRHPPPSSLFYGGEVEVDNLR